MAFETFGKPDLEDVCKVVSLYLSESSPVWKKIDGGIYKHMENRVRETVIMHALKHHKGAIAPAARTLGMNRTYLSRLCKNLGIDSSSFKPDYPWPYPPQKK